MASSESKQSHRSTCGWIVRYRHPSRLSLIIFDAFQPLLIKTLRFDSERIDSKLFKSEFEFSLVSIPNKHPVSVRFCCRGKLVPFSSVSSRHCPPFGRPNTISKKILVFPTNQNRLHVIASEEAKTLIRHWNSNSI